jgi:Domain of unknown function (DUF4160)
MPEVSRFYGIIIRLYYRDHPPSHFHAIYEEHEALIEIETGAINQGICPGRLMTLSTDGARRICRNSATIGTVLGSSFPCCRLPRSNK